jgi:hypothetical protein
MNQSAGLIINPAGLIREPSRWLKNIHHPLVHISPSFFYNNDDEGRSLFVRRTNG